VRHAISILLTLLTVNAANAQASAQASAQANAQAFVGRWYGEDVMECKGKRGGRVAPLEYTAKEVFGLETPCQIVSATPKGTATELTLRCRGETSRETVEVQGRQLKRTKMFEGKKMTFTQTRCP
jgi:hypothetical protein